MKRRLTAFAVMLCACLLVKLGVPVVAEMTELGGNGYSVEFGYVDDRAAPVSATITKDIIEQTDPVSTETTSEPAEEVKRSQHEFEFITPYGDGSNQVARTVVTMEAAREVSDEEWEALMLELRTIVYAQSGVEVGEVAEDIARNINSIERSGEADELGAVALINDQSVTMIKLTFEAPYYPVLKRGDKNDDVKALQEKLIVLGYLDGQADGQFGGMTEAAIKEVEAGLRAIEQAEIDAMATPVPTATPEPTPEPTLEIGQTPDPNATEEPAPVPTPEPMPAPTPKIEVDGTADLGFQLRLNSDEFPLISAPIDKGSDLAVVIRLQRRLVQLGCLTDKPDGDYGGNTRRGVRIFQHYNGLAETGIADEATQRAIFNALAKAPATPLMTLGSEGDAVKRLQSRLIQLGFMTGSPDGAYGNGTQVGVSKMQTYLQAREIEELTREIMAKLPLEQQRVMAAPDSTAAPTATLVPEGTTEPAITVTPTIEVNGVADPMLMDMFYATDFSAPVMRNGDVSLDVERMQRRLRQLEYLYSAQDGSYGNGTESAVRDFQKRNSMPQDGIAGLDTQNLLFSDNALKALKPYLVKISVDKQKVYVYGLDSNNEHTDLVKTMTCSTGLSSTPTPKGTYIASTGPGARWHYFKKFTCWAQYAYYIEGDIMIHSVLYSRKGGSATGSSVRNLGSRASHGCVRLSVDNAKWLYQNCPPNTKIVVY